MAGEKQDNVWPLPAFYFKVSIDGVGDMSFSEISGMDIEFDSIDYRAGDSKNFSKVRMPGLRKHGEVTLKKGIFISDKKFWDWIKQVTLNTIERHSVTISLLDEKGNAAQTWALTNAWPKKLSIESFKADGNDVAMETMILVHEGLEMK